jgi:hypothetical protein
MRLNKTAVAVLAVSGVAAAAPVASAQSTPVQEGYSTPSGVVQTQIRNNTPAPPEATVEAKTTVQAPAAKSSQLPFTGLDVGLVLATGAMLLAAGLGIRRLSRSNGAA